MALFLPRTTSTSYRRSVLDPERNGKGLRSSSSIGFGIVARLFPVVAVVVLATALGCGSEPETVENPPTTPSSGVGSSMPERSQGSPAAAPVPTTALAGSGEATKTVSADTAGQPSSTPTQPVPLVAPTDTLRPPTSTPALEPAPTATVAVHTQQGGSVIMQAPTSTPTPHTRTPTPVPALYWEQFTQSEYDQFLPPKGAIRWEPFYFCLPPPPPPFELRYVATDAVKSEIHWMGPNVEKVMRFNLHSTAMKALAEEHPGLLGDEGAEPEVFCGFAETLDPRVPVVRAVFEFNARRGEPWRRPMDPKGSFYEWDAYRVEARYVLQDNPEYEKIRHHHGFDLEQLGPILIEKLNSPCDRTSAHVSPVHYCRTAP